MGSKTSIPQPADNSGYAAGLIWLMKDPRGVILFLFISFPLIAQSLKSELDLYSVYIRGEIGQEDYLRLKDMMETPLGLCASLSGLSAVPGITAEDLDTLEQLCASTPLGEECLPNSVADKIRPFIAQNPRGAGLSAEYRFTRDLEDSLPSLEKEHAFSLRYNIPHITARSQGRSDAYGQGYFYRNSLEASNLGVLRKLTLGSFQPRIGMGLTLGNIARTDQSPALPASFEQSLFAPSAPEPFGAYLMLRAGPWRPFVLASGTPASPGRASYKTIRALGLEIPGTGRTLGALIVASETPALRPENALLSRCAGFYGSVYRKHSSLSAEISLSREGYGMEVRGLKRSTPLDFGLKAWKFSSGYLNPVGRGGSLLGDSRQEVITGADTMLLYGLRSDQWGGEAFARLRTGAIQIRPSLASVQSARTGMEKTQTSLQESFSFRSLHARVTAEQRFTFSRTPVDTMPQGSCSFSAESTPAPLLSLRLQGKVTGGSKVPGTWFAQSDVFTLPWPFFRLHAGYYIRSNLQAPFAPKGGVVLEEEFLNQRQMALKCCVALVHSKARGLEAQSLGLRLLLTAL
jgi:hypothetical protein